MPGRSFKVGPAALALVTGALLSACQTTYLTATLAPASPETGAVSGVSYNLARLNYSIDITRAVTACPTDAEASVEWQIEAAATSTYGPGEEVLNDYAKLAKAWKTTSISFETYDNGMLKSVNSQVTSQEGAAFKSAVGLAVGVAKLAIGVPPISGATGVAAGPAAAPEWRARVVCTPTGDNLVKVYKAAVETRDDTATKRDAAKAALDAFDVDHAGDDRPSDAVKAERVKLAGEQRATAKAATDAVNALTKAKAAVSFGTQVAITEGLAFNDEDLIKPATAGAFIAKMFEVRLNKDGVPDVIWPAPADFVFKAPAGSSADQIVAARGALETITKRGGVIIDFRSLRPQKAATGIAAAVTCSNLENAEPCGVLYRATTPARLQVCKNTAREACSGLAAGNVNLVLRDERNAPQLGGLRSLALRNDPFESNSLVATFRADSSLATVAYVKSSAEGVDALNAASDVVNGASQVVGYDKAKDSRRIANATAASKARAAAEEARAAEAEARIKRIAAEAKAREAEEAEASGVNN